MQPVSHVNVCCRCSCAQKSKTWIGSTTFRSKCGVDVKSVESCLIAVTAIAIQATFFGTKQSTKKESTKKHDLDHDFLYEGRQSKQSYPKILSNPFKSSRWLLQLLGKNGKIQSVCTYVWTDGWIGRWVHECVDVWMCRCMYARMHVFLTLCIGFKGACMNVCKQVS